MLNEEYEYKMIARRWVTPSIAELEFKPTDAHISYMPGQYVLLEDIEAQVPIRSYSIANAPRSDGIITLLITLVPEGPTSTWLIKRLAVGGSVVLSGPYGDFVRDKANKNNILTVAGGSGWAPIRAIIMDMMNDNYDHTLTVVFSARTEDDVIDRELINIWRQENKLFKYIRTLTRANGSEPTGRIQKVLPRLFDKLIGTDVFVAGPPGIVSGCVETIRSIGLKDGSLFTEEYYSDPTPWS